jgi:hypothetical protein
VPPLTLSSYAATQPGSAQRNRSPTSSTDFSPVRVWNESSRIWTSIRRNVRRSPWRTSWAVRDSVQMTIGASAPGGGAWLR